jgi:hypothetical protein
MIQAVREISYTESWPSLFGFIQTLVTFQWLLDPSPGIRSLARSQDPDTTRACSSKCFKIVAAEQLDLRGMLNVSPEPGKACQDR